MRKARWLAEWRKSAGKPVLYHVISRVVDRRFVLGTEEKEKFRTLMRMQENFTGCRVLSYCLMDNHFHLLLEVPPMAEGGLSDEELLKRLSAIYGEAFVAGVAKELMDARTAVYANESGMNEAVAAIHKRFTYRMHDLGEFMKGLSQRFTQWFNRAHSRTGTLWEDRFKSVIVEQRRGHSLCPRRTLRQVPNQFLRRSRRCRIQGAGSGLIIALHFTTPSHVKYEHESKCLPPAGSTAGAIRFPRWIWNLADGFQTLHSCRQYPGVDFALDGAAEIKPSTEARDGLAAQPIHETS